MLLLLLLCLFADPACVCGQVWWREPGCEPLRGPGHVCSVLIVILADYDEVADEDAVSSAEATAEAKAQ